MGKLSSPDYFQCQICEIYFPTLWKVEKHVNNHETQTSKGGGQWKRGMLPIKKVTLPWCQILLTRVKVPKNGLGQSINAQSDHSKRPRPRQSQIKAGEKIRNITRALQNVPERRSKKKCNEELEFAIKENEDEESGTDDEKTMPFKKHKVGEDKTFPPKYLRPPKTGMENMLTCEFCERKVRSKSALSKHILDFHADKTNTISCLLPTCNQLFLSYFNLYQHLTFHRLAEKKETEIMEKEIDADAAAESEENSSSDENEDSSTVVLYRKKKPELLKKYFFCKYCLCRWKSLKKLQIHLNKAHKTLTEDGLTCPCCEEKDGPMRYSSVHVYVKHICSKHPLRVNPFQEKRPWKIKRKKKTNRKPGIGRGRRAQDDGIMPDPVDGLFKCDKCYKVYRSKHELKRHKGIHEDKELERIRLEDEKLRIFPCKVCGKRFKYKDNLSRHLNLHMDDSPFVCDFPGCGKKLNSNYNLARHKLLHVEGLEEEKIQCPLCPGMYTKKYLERHLRYVHNPSDLAKPRKIPRRKPRKYVPRASVYSVTNHSDADGINGDSKSSDETSSDDEESFQGKVKKEVPTSDNILALEEIHLTDKILVGPDGEAIHLKGEILDPDVRDTSTPILTLPTSTSCEVKTEPIKDKNRVARQSRGSTTLASFNGYPGKAKSKKVKPVKNFNAQTVMKLTKFAKSFPCPECSFNFTRAWTLQLHLTTVHKKTILNQAEVSNEESNTGSVTLMCGFCAYPAKNAKDLQKHIERQHPRRFQCHFKKCSISFTNPERLKKHVEIHKNEGHEHKCHFCKKSFLKESYVRKHETKVHLQNGDKKMIECRICKKLYTASSIKPHLKRHEDAKKMARGEKVKRHKCMLCNDDFATTSCLKRHIDGIHLGKPLNKRQKVLPRLGRGPTLNSLKSKTEWYLPLLQKMGLREATTSSSNSTTEKIHGRDLIISEKDRNSSSEPPSLSENQTDKETQDSILGF